MDRLRMNNHSTPTTPDEAKLRPVWSTLPLQGRVRRLSAIADIAICNRPGAESDAATEGRIMSATSMSSIEPFDLFAIRYGRHGGRRASDNFIGADPHEAGR